MRILTPVILIAIWGASSVQSPGNPAQVTVPGNTGQSCEPLGTAYLRTTLYFGLTHSEGTVSQREWQAFLRDEVTPRFPDGLTVWEAAGQWRRSDGRISRERAKVLLLVHDETPAVRTSVAAVVENYKRAFRQESVLWETARVCAAF